MCGIVGYVGPKNALDVIIGGLERLEYRGYDSAGVAVIADGQIRVTRAVGKLENLKKSLEDAAVPAVPHLGIGHTRWATHGKPSETNAHPHSAGKVSLIHNGIIENYMTLRADLEREGCIFRSDTDTEIAAHLCNRYISKGLDLFNAMKAMCAEIKGSYAFLVIDERYPDRIVAAKNSSPIVLGIGAGEMWVASDIPAILGSTRQVVILEDGDITEVRANTFRIEHDGKEVERTPMTITWDPVTAQKGGFKHFMLKEIHDQPQVVTDCVRGRLRQDVGSVELPELPPTLLKEVQRVLFLGCGTAWHAALLGKFYLESLARIPCEVDYASEFRYREPVLDARTLVVAISQSGETADTLGAVDVAVKHARTLAICNVLGSSLSRKVESTVFTHAGPEISVASTKAFTTQVLASYLLALVSAEQRSMINKAKLAEHTHAIALLPMAMQAAVATESSVREVARRFQTARDFLFLGRGLCYPVALEGALKLKEISYIHAEGYPAGEMKHGPIALIDDKMPVVMVVQRSPHLRDKAMSNLREVHSRDAQVIAVTDTEGDKELRRYAAEVIEVPFVSDLLSPLILTVPLQLLAYYVAVLNGTDVDLPRNLAKSVTVE
ncbi:MAG: glutamine--fructose-6-phosphate transaminase (isomerizing) [Bdellovibrionota bacterium]|nr:MAG: glutamine--fructose-6-phosphate transaminase (isomerizing) [Bdellovibrionota bacterium]